VVPFDALTLPVKEVMVYRIASSMLTSIEAKKQVYIVHGQDYIHAMT
jgi:hypothetical protein